MRSSRLLVGLTAAWLACGVLATLAFRASIAIGSVRMSTPMTAPRLIVMQMAPWVAVALLTPAVLWICARLPISRTPWPRTAVTHATAAVGFALLAPVVSLELTAAARGELVVPSAETLGARIVLVLLNSLLEYGIIVGVAEAARHYAEARDRGSEAARLAQRSVTLERDLSAAQLVAMQQQLRPHFLFNALNAITSLIDERPAAAKELVVRLGDLLRLSLDRRIPSEVTLGDELDHADRYLAVERARFGEQLTVSYAVDEAALGVLVPSFVLQPLVENAIRHGFAKLETGGAIEIGAERAGDHLLMWVTNDMPRPGERAEGHGVGLTQVRSRLAVLYGADAHLTAASDRPGGFRVTLKLPCRQAPVNS